jgi:hypothetical protein
MNAKLTALLGAVMAALVLEGVGCVAESADEAEGATAQTAGALTPTLLKNPIGTAPPQPKSPPPINTMDPDPQDPDPSPWRPEDATDTNAPGVPEPLSNH